VEQRLYRFLGLILAITLVLGCQKRALFNPALASRFYPLRPGLTWTYQVAYPNGAHETIRDRVLKADQAGLSHTAALVVSNYSGLDCSRALRADLPQTYPAEMTEVQIGYVIEGGYINRVASLGGRTQTRLEERGFLPQNLWPDRIWSNSLSPFEHSPLDILKVAQSHRSFLEPDPVVVPGGRFSECIRIETEASYQSLAGRGDKRYFTDWYAPDVGLVKTLVLSGGQDGREMARIELLRFTKSKTTAPLESSNGPSIVPLSSKIAKPPVRVGSLTHK
jgi:hypothetical protein